MDKCDRSREARDKNIIKRMRIACCINKAKNEHSKRAIFIAFSTAKVVKRIRRNVRFIRLLPLLFYV